MVYKVDQHVFPTWFIKNRLKTQQISMKFESWFHYKKHPITALAMLIKINPRNFYVHALLTLLYIIKVFTQ